MKTRVVLRFLAPLFVLGLVVLSFNEAAARAGGGRSFGSRGSSSYRSPARTSPSYNYSSRQQQTQAAPQTQSFGQGMGGGGLLRNIGTGLLGGFLGSMLFRGLGFAGPGLGSGGMGLFEILLLAGLGYMLFRFVTSRRRTQTAGADSSLLGQSWRQGNAAPSPYSPEPESSDTFAASSGGGPAAGLAHIRQMDPAFDEARFRDTAQDIFFRIQGAWTRRDLGPVESLLGDEVRRALQADLEDLKRRGEINRLENIAVREAEIVEAWQERGQDFIALRLLASLLDYNTDEAGTVRSGSDREPVKFEEYWTFTRPVGAGPWQLTAIQQA